ncbi:hypothetical protein K1719_043812 [Acacia pycnantha]|nr:hypothetical protein K1719_043812 [Acacia pycnantha]
MIHAARGIFNRLLPDVHIFTDHKAGPQAGKSPGYGISLVAETTSDDEKKVLIPPEDVGQRTAYALLQETQQGGVVDSTHQGLLFLLCALSTRCFQDSHGTAIPDGIETLRNIAVLKVMTHHEIIINLLGVALACLHVALNGLVASFWAALSFLWLFAYPTPELPTPSFEYHTAFNGVALGIGKTPRWIPSLEAGRYILLCDANALQEAGIKLKAERSLLISQILVEDDRSRLLFRNMIALEFWDCLKDTYKEVDVLVVNKIANSLVIPILDICTRLNDCGQDPWHKEQQVLNSK